MTFLFYTMPRTIFLFLEQSLRQDEIISFFISLGANSKNCQSFHISIMLNIYSNAKLNQQKYIFPMNEK